MPTSVIWGDLLYICTQEDLRAFCERAASTKLLALDTEFLRERSYYPKLCLIQMATADEIAVVDCLAFAELRPLADLLENDRIEKIFHACSQDVEVLFDALHVVPNPVFDTQIAASFLGMRQQIGYGDLVEEFCHVHLTKAEALSDWSRRPLSDEQIEYAADDVRYLPRVYEEMVTRLGVADRLGWVLPEMDTLVEKASQQRDPREAYLHLKRVSSLTRRQLAIAREACAWREYRAAEKNIPRRWLLSDEVIVECCRRIPRNVNALKRIRGAEQLSAEDAEAFMDALRVGSSARNDDLPRSRRRERPSLETEGVVDLMYAMLRIISKECGVAPQVLASRDDLLDLVLDRGEPRLLQGWRHEVVGARLQALLNGTVGLTVHKGKIELV